MKDLKSTLPQFKNKKILVVGDIMLDHYILGSADRISPEAPVPIVRVTHDTFFLGGAGNTAANVNALGANTMIMGRLGYDEAGEIVRRLLGEIGMSTKNILRDIRTIEKIRIVAKSGHQVARIDRDSDTPLADWNEEIVIRWSSKLIEWCDALIVSDYHKGFITERFGRGLVLCALEMKKIIVVDTKPEHFDFFTNATVIKPNKIEAEKVWGRNIATNDDAAAAGLFLQKHLSSPILMTRGSDGMTIIDGNEVTHLPSMGREVFDVTGAGDTVTAVLALGLASGMSLTDAAIIANYAAAIVIGKMGTATVTLEELMRFMP